jgi:sensor histidine kinase YesM
MVVENNSLESDCMVEPNWFSLGRGAFIVIVFLFIIGMLNFGVDVFGNLIWGRPSPCWFNYLVNELTSTLLNVPLLPFLFSFFWRYPLTLANLWHRILLYFAALLIYGCMHTTLMSIARVALYDLFNLGVYSSGEVFYRYLFEFFKQLPAFCYFYLGFYVYRSAIKSQYDQLRFAKLQENLGKARLNSLKHQLNPHFLFNMLNVISEEMYESAENADRLISELSLLLRKNLENVRSDKVPVAEELEYVALYMNLMKARFGDALDYQVDCSPGVKRAFLPVFTLQPLVENAVKYAMYFKPKASVVRVEAESYDDALILRVIDNGPGLRSGLNVEGTGVGLANIKGRLSALYGEGKASLVLRDHEGDGCTAEVVLPLEMEKEK